MTREFIRLFMNGYFHDYDIDEVYERDAVDYHAMTSEHTEILGQFLDCTGLGLEQLKECLVAGLIVLQKGL